MNRKVFSTIRSKCKTRSQMRAFNRLLSTFSTGSLSEPTNIIKAVLPMEMTALILQDNENLINSSDLIYTDENSILGREYDPHISLFIGVPDEKSQAIMDDLFGTLPIHCVINGISTFENGDRAVIKYDVFSDQLIAIHDELKSKYNLDEKYDTYVPHITMAYVKPGSEVPNIENSNLQGYNFDITEFIYSNQIMTGQLS